MTKHRAAAKRQTLPGRGRAWHDQQHLPAAEPAAHRQGGIQQGGADAAPSSLRRDHASQLERGAEAVEPEEPKQPVALPPQQVLDAFAAAAAKPSPFELQAAAVHLDHPPLELGDGLQSA